MSTASLANKISEILMMDSSIRAEYTIIFLLFCITNAFADANGSGDMTVDKTSPSACFTCHGKNGNSQNERWPILAGQDPEYIVRQLTAFKSGKRHDESMNSIVANLDEREINALATYFSRQVPVSAGRNPPQPERGQQIYNENCWACHGKDARGQEGYPKLAGQHPEYLIRQLSNFKNGTRSSATMQAIVVELNLEDIHSLGEYLGSLTGKNDNSQGWVIGSGQ